MPLVRCYNYGSYQLTSIVMAEEVQTGAEEEAQEEGQEEEAE